MISDYIPARALVVTPHGDDATLFAGGTIAGWASSGARVCVVRVTQDEKDSFVHGVDQAVRVNAAEFEDAMRVLGVAETVNLGFRDCELMDVRYGILRERLIREIRRFRPDIVVGFDPALTDDENPDHQVVARATADASWAAGYPNFHPEHREAGLDIHVPLGNWYFTRHFVVGETVVDISATLPTKLKAVNCHRNMMRTLMHEQKRRLEAAGFRFPFLSDRQATDCGDYWDVVITAAAAMAAEESGLEAGERFRSNMIGPEDSLVCLLSSMKED